MKKIILLGLAILFNTAISAQKTKKEQDVEAIKSMCGCFKVSFNFTETFKYSKDSTYKPSKTKHDRALEWVELITNNDDKIQLQHLLIVGGKEKPFIIKHWRQDWLFENQDLYMFDKNTHWKYTNVATNKVKGQWTQKVFQVDDSPRYEGTATWVHVDGKSFWENTTNAPLARREETQRKDYNVLLRRNRHEITQNGWIHDQDNDKIIRKDNKKDVILAQEKGYNTYTRVDNSQCIAAQNWWKENQQFWKHVRNKWSDTFKKKEDITLREKVNNKKLFSLLFKMDKNSNKNEIYKIIDAFLKK